MATLRLARRNPTLIANPRTRRARKARTSARRNPPRRRAKARRNPATRRARRRNPGLDFQVAGIPVFEVALGAAGAIALIQGVMAIPFVSEQASKDSAVAKLVGPGLAFGAGWAAYKYIKNPMIKSIGKYACVAAVVVGVNELAGTQIRNAITKLTNTSGLSGAFVSLDKSNASFGGAYIQAPKAFGARSFT